MRDGAVASLLLGLGLVGLVVPASAQVYEGSIAGYCQYIPPPGADQPFTLTTPIPAGRTVHIDVVTSAGVTLQGVDDAGHDGYTVVTGGTDGSFTASLVAGVVETALPTGNSITVHLASSGGGTSCASAFVASGVVDTPDQTAFATGSGASIALTTGALGAPRELVHAVLFGHPTTVNEPVAMRAAPLVDAGNVCVGTSSGRLCSFDSYALLDAGDPFAASIDLDASMAWGFAVATFEAGHATTGGPVIGWGDDGSGESTPPAAVNGAAGRARAIAAGSYHSCAIQSGTGAVVCWGDNTYNQTTPPASVDGTAGTARAIAAGYDYSCAIRAESGAVVCWGDDTDGEATPPAAVDGTAGTASAIAAGIATTCAIQAGSGAVICWGSDFGTGALTPPDSVNGSAGTATAITVGRGYSCAIRASDRGVVCWGRNDVGQSTPPDSVNGTAGSARAIVAQADSYHTCAIQTGTSDAVCWGSNGFGQASPPDTVAGPAGTASAVAAGLEHSCAIRAESGAVVCWGDDTLGEATPPAAVNGAAGTASAIAAGDDYTLAIQSPEPDALALGAAALAPLLAEARVRRRSRFAACDCAHCVATM